MLQIIKQITIAITRPHTTVRNSDVQVCIVWEYDI